MEIKEFKSYHLFCVQLYPLYIHERVSLDLYIQHVKLDYRQQQQHIL